MLRRLSLLVLFTVTPAWALESPASWVRQLQDGWAVANYELKDKEQIQAFQKLLGNCDQARREHPDSADILIWDGIIKSTYAGVKGGLGALSLAKESRDSLERALSIDSKALAGSAYTSLGTLYDKVPGWPVGFGDDKKAKALLQKALEINPDGIDSNYFYASYLLDEGDYQKAEIYLLKAQKAPPRPDRRSADQGRQQEIARDLARVHQKMGH